MKFLPLIWAGLWRKPVRTVFTVLSVTVAFVLFGILQGVAASRQHLLDELRLDRIDVYPRLVTSLPIGYLNQIEKVPGVKSVAPIGFLFGYYKDPKVRLGAAIYMIDERIFTTFPEFGVITPEQKGALLRTRTGLIVSRKLADRFGWKAGDHLPLHLQYQGAIPPAPWTFDVLAVAPDIDLLANGYALGNYDYLDQTRDAASKGTVGWIDVRTQNASQADRVTQVIDGMFANSTYPTFSITEKADVQSNQSAIFNATFFTQMVVSAAFITLLLVTGNTMMQSVRERRNEFAVWKTLGFTDGAVLVIVLAEAVVLCVLGAGAGLAIAQAIMPLARKTIGVAVMPPIVVLEGLAAAVLTALASGMIPALQANRMTIVEALRR